jgi:DNA-binding beta-propeller fold protein YncE
VSGTKTTVTVADFNNYRIRQFPITLTAGVPTPGTITTIAGNGSGYGGDGGLATNAGMTQPWGLTADSAGNFYIGEYGSNHIRKLTKSTASTFTISTVSGWGQTNYSDPVAIKNVPGTGIALNSPYGVFADPDSPSVYVAGSLSEAVYLLNSTTGLISNFAGNGIPGFAGDGLPGKRVYRRLLQLCHP